MKDFLKHLLMTVYDKRIPSQPEDVPYLASGGGGTVCCLVPDRQWKDLHGTGFTAWLSGERASPGSPTPSEPLFPRL